MTNVEIVCCVLSLIETAITAYVVTKHKKKLDAATKAAKIAQAEYEAACKRLNLWRNAT